MLLFVLCVIGVRFFLVQDQTKIGEPSPINWGDLPRGKGIRNVQKLSASSSPFFVDLIIEEVANTPPPGSPFLQVHIAPLMLGGSNNQGNNN